MRRKSVETVIAMYPEIYYAKKYEYVAKKVKNHYEIYCREYEGAKWKLYAKAVIVDDIIFTNFVGLLASNKTENVRRKR